jgi:hypothetical protein
MLAYRGRRQRHLQAIISQSGSGARDAYQSKA